MTDKTYTVAELLAMPDDALNAMAAELLGATVLNDHGDDYLSFGNDFFRDCNGKWNPVGNRNQSGELLIEATRQGASFTVDFDEVGRIEWRIPSPACPQVIRESVLDEFTEDAADTVAGCTTPNSTYQCGGYCNCHCHKRPCGTISGSDAHAETVAFCAAMLALKGGLTQ